MVSVYKPEQKSIYVQLRDSLNNPEYSKIIKEVKFEDLDDLIVSPSRQKIIIYHNIASKTGAIHNLVVSYDKNLKIIDMNRKL